MTNEIIPISDEQAKAIQEALKTLQGVGGFLKETFGTLPQDIVGLLGGDYLKVRRAENLFRTIEKAKKRLEDQGVREPDAPPSLAIPIMIAAADESRDELQDLWAALLAAAANPKMSKTFRLKFIGVVKLMDPLDARTLNELVVQSMADTKALGGFPISLEHTPDEVIVSLENLVTIGLARRGSSAEESPNYRFISATALGRELLRAVEGGTRTQAVPP